MASTYLSLRIHVIFATRLRAPSISSEWRDDLHAYLGGIARGLGAFPIQIGGTADHVHLLLGIKATQCVADLVREIKKASTDWAMQNWEGFRWQEGYAVLTVSHGDLSRVAEYIANQEEHHRTLSSDDELRAILRDSGIEYDDRYFE